MLTGLLRNQDHSPELRKVRRSVKRACILEIRTLRHLLDACARQWTFTLGLGLSSAVDLIVTVSLFVLLKENGDKGYLRYVYALNNSSFSHSPSSRIVCALCCYSLGHIIDALVLYTVEIGSVTWWVRQERILLVLVS